MKAMFPREYYIPKDAVAIEDKDADGVVCHYERNGVLYAMAFHGKKAAPDWHFRFSSAKSRDDKTAGHFANLKGHKKMMAERKAERKNVPASGKDWPSCAETASLVRAALKQSFPGVKFSVRSDTYSMGASIDVRWTDGPSSKAVEKVAKQFEGADFDGMIDLKSYNDHWLSPDGTVRLAHADGTVGSLGVIPGGEWKGPADARKVHLGADYVFCNRDLSAGFLRLLAAKVGKKYGVPAPEVVEDKHGTHLKEDYTNLVGDRPVTDFVHWMAQETNA